MLATARPGPVQKRNAVKMIPSSARSEAWVTMVMALMVDLPLLSVGRGRLVWYKLYIKNGTDTDSWLFPAFYGNICSLN
jgi:hypothetical protein